MPYSDLYLKAVKFVLDHEGRVFENVSGDPGGATKYGISKKSYPLLDIKSLTEQQAIDIYYRDYWTPLMCEQAGQVAGIKLALAIFDSGVNCGVPLVQKWLIDPKVKVSHTEILFKRLRRYADLCQKNKTLNKFLLGWLIRVLHVFTYGE